MKTISTVAAIAAVLFATTFNPAPLAAEESDLLSTGDDDTTEAELELAAMRQAETWAHNEAEAAKKENAKLREELAAAKAKSETLEAVAAREPAPALQPESPTTAVVPPSHISAPHVDPTWYRHTGVINGRVKIPNLFGNPGLEWSNCDDCWKVANVSEGWVLVRFGHVDAYLHRGGQSIVDPLGRGVYLAPAEYVSIPTEDGEINFSCVEVRQGTDGFRLATTPSLQTLTQGIVGSDKTYTIGNHSCPG